MMGLFRWHSPPAKQTQAQPRKHGAAGSKTASQAAERPFRAVLEQAYALLETHGLTGWRVKLDHARRRAGMCDYNNRVISLSRHYVRAAPPEHIKDTILHEIAHALTGPGHGHDAYWRRMARSIGCTAARCHTLDFSQARWLMRCPNGCFEVPRHRRSARLVCTHCKSPVIFVPGQDLGPQSVL